MASAVGVGACSISASAGCERLHGSKARRIASGSLAITVRKARAGPVGTRLPCSQCSSVRLLRPNNLANSLWEREIFIADCFHVDVFRNMNYAAVVLPAFREGQRLPGTLDHSLSGRWSLLLHFCDLYYTPMEYSCASSRRKCSLHFPGGSP